jgi:broad specificity phosphatase PhoE
MQIILARHGKPLLNHWAWIAPREMKDWIDRYNQADLVAEPVPAAAVEAATMSAIVITSTLKRCAHSAELLCRERPILVEALFREPDLPHTTWRFPKLPLSFWGVVFRLAWFFGFSGKVESVAQATLRAHSAADILVAITREKGSVLLVGHGIMSMLIAKRLVELGWVGPRRPLNKFWQFSVYHYAAA